MAINIQKDIDKLIDSYFNQPLILYEHLFASYNQFIEEIIPYCLKQEQNYFYENIDGHLVHFHGFKCDNIRIKPATFDNDNEIKFPNEARKNHLNYFASIIVDIKQYIETNNILTGDKTFKDVYSENNISIGNIPIMIKSKYCSTHIKKDSHGECRFDPGGYFLVNGQEKIIMSIEKMADNKIFIFAKKDPSFENGFTYSAHINSRKNDWSDSLQIAYIKTRKDGVLSLSSSQLVDIPIFIIFRALGLETDQDIISKICYNLDDVKMLNLIRPSMIFSQDEEGNQIKTKEEAINYLINKLSKTRRISQTDEALATKQKIMILQKIIRQDLLLHLGDDIPKKIMFIGLMVNKLLQVMLGKADPDDRDYLHNKRIETPGILLGQLFRQNWRKMLSEIGKLFRKKNQFDITPINVISQIKSTTIEQGIKTALATGVWGMNRSRNGVAQALQRLSWIQSQSYFRRILTTTLDSSTSAVVSIRLVENNQYKFLCVTGDTEILLANKIETKMIKDFTNNDWVNSINNTTLDDEPTNIHSYFSKLPDKLFELTTESGRIIKATANHPFLVNNNGIYEWKDLEKLDKNDKIVIRHSVKHIPNDIEYKTKVMITENELSLEQYKIELINTGLLNKYLDINKLKIIARLIGVLNTCGFIRYPSENNKLNLTCSFHLNEECDVIQLIDDIKNLGFGTASISRTVTTPNENKLRKISSSKTWCVIKNGAFPFFMLLVSESKGDIKKIPDWLLNSELSIKREFLSAFQGGDGSKVLFQKNTNYWYPSIGKTFYTTYNKNIVEITTYMESISKMFKDFNIENELCNIKVDQLKTKVCIIFDNSIKNLANYVDNIGYTYNDEKRRGSSVVIEQIKIMEFNEINHKDNENITDSIYDNYLYKMSSYNGCVGVLINTIKEIPVELVYDFTTVCDNHSFVASSFVTHNCPVETPEGAKIGIVKSMAMMSSITSQNNAQEKVLTTILNSNKKIKHPADINPLDMNLHVKIFMNGNWFGVIRTTYIIDVYKDLKEKRKENIIDKHTSMLLDYDKKELRIYFDGGRLIRPLLIVDDNKLNINEDVIKMIDEEQHKTEFNKSWKNLLNKYRNIIEYEDIETCNLLIVNFMVGLC
jgi:intein/homing endonuclease